MTLLIDITSRSIGGDTVQTVNARDLHAFLGVRQDFNRWARTQIRRSRLVEGREYLAYLEVVQMASGSKQLTQYAITIESAKHIAMMSGTEKGFEVREYFIDCERKAKAAHAQIDNSLYARALEAETREAKSFAAAQLGSRLMLLRKSEKAALQEDVALMREHMQLRLALGLGGV